MELSLLVDDLGQYEAGLFFPNAAQFFIQWIGGHFEVLHVKGTKSPIKTKTLDITRYMFAMDKSKNHKGICNLLTAQLSHVCSHTMRGQLVLELLQVSLQASCWSGEPTTIIGTTMQGVNY